MATDDVPFDEYEEPFDPNFHIAIRPRCPGLHDRFPPSPVVMQVPCKSILTWHSDIEMKSNSSFHCKTPEELDLGFTKRARCGNIVTADIYSIRRYIVRVEWGCYHNTSNDDNAQGYYCRSTPHVAHSSDFLFIDILYKCRYIRHVYDTRPGRKYCLKIVGSPYPATNIIKPNNRYCAKYLFIPNYFASERVCRKYFATHASIIQANGFTYKIKNCIITGTFNAEEIPGSRICNTDITAPDFVNSKGSIAPRSGLCRDSDIANFVNYPMNKLCNIHKLVFPVAFRYVKSSPCRVRYTFYGNVAQRSRCGTMSLAITNDLQYGRIWGGREFSPYPTRLRVSGRMIGKIK